MLASGGAVSLSRQIGAYTNWPGRIQRAHGGSPFGAGRAALNLRKSVQKDDGLGNFGIRMGGCGPFGLWHPQMVDGGLQIEVPSYPGGTVSDLVLDATVSETGGRIAAFARPMEWRPATEAEAPAASWSSESANGAPIAVLYPDGRASARGSNFIDWPYTLWIPDATAGGYQTTAELSPATAPTLFGPLRQEAASIATGLAATLGVAPYYYPGSGTYSDNVDTDVIYAQEQAAVWYCRDPADAARCRRCWDPFWSLMLGANFANEAAIGSLPFEGAPDSGTGTSGAEGWWGHRGRFWTWRLGDAMRGPFAASGGSVEEWINTWFDPLPDDIATANHDPPGRLITWGVPETGNIYFHDHNGDPSSGGLVSLNGYESEMVVEWAPCSWVAGWRLAVTGPWTDLLGGTIASVWTPLTSGIGYSAPIVNPPSVGACVAIRIRKTTTSRVEDIINFLGIPDTARLTIPFKPPPPPWCVPTATGAIIGYRP